MGVLSCRYDIVHHLSGVGRSPPRGGADPNDSNQQFVADSSGSDDELCAPGGAPFSHYYDRSTLHILSDRRRSKLVIQGPTAAARKTRSGGWCVHQCYLGYIICTIQTAVL